MVWLTKPEVGSGVVRFWKDGAAVAKEERVRRRRDGERVR